MNRKEFQETQKNAAEKHDLKYSGKGLSTQCIHSGQDPGMIYGGVNVPIYTSSTYVQPCPGEPLGPWFYTRNNNPTRKSLERVITLTTIATAGAMVNIAALIAILLNFFFSIPISLPRFHAFIKKKIDCARTIKIIIATIKNKMG